MRNAFWGILIILVVFRYSSLKPHYEVGQRLRIEAPIASEPVTKEYVFGKKQLVSLGQIKAYLAPYPEVFYGDYVVIEGTVGENSVLVDATLVKLKTSSSFIPKIRKRILTFFQKSLPEPHASLVGGMVLGSKAGLQASFWEQLRKTGTAHVVVASGMNVTMVARFLLTLLLGILTRKIAIVLAIAGIWVYALLSGLDAPIVRAAVMATITFGAQEVGRVSYAWRALFLSGLLMLLVNPMWINDLGFVLSFFATASILLLEEKVRNLISKVPGIFKEGLSTSLAAQVGVAPIIYVSFGQFNILSPLINSLVLWTVAPITVIGGLAGLASLAFAPLARLIILLDYPLTYWFISTINYFS